MVESLEVLIPATSGHVGLRFLEPQYAAGELVRFAVEIADPSICARTSVYADGSDGLATLFKTMADNWQGWKSPLTWGSLEGELDLSCTSDGLGHVRIAVRIRPSDIYDKWNVDAVAHLEAGQLDGVAKSIRRFVEPPSTA